MNRLSLQLKMILFLAMAVLWSPVHAEISYEGTSKGTVVRMYKADHTDFKAPVKKGPWNERNPDSAPTVAAIGIGDADARITRIANVAAEVVPDLLSGVSGLKVATKLDVKKYLKSKDLPGNPKGDNLATVRDHALSRYDVVLFVWFSKGWLRFNASHAISENKARYHGFSVYLADSPSDQDIRDAVKPDQIVHSIDMALGRQKE